MYVPSVCEQHETKGQIPLTSCYIFSVEVILTMERGYSLKMTSVGVGKPYKIKIIIIIINK